jgi:hypothetical protein
MSEKSAQNPFLFWLLVLGVIFFAALVLAEHWTAVRLAQVVWHQLAAGLAITVFGGMLAGWGIAAFIASSKGNTAPKAPAPGTSHVPNDPSPQPRPGEGLDQRPENPARSTVLKPGDPLTDVPGIGPVRAKAAATLGFNSLADVDAAEPARQQQLRTVLGTALFTALVIVAHNSIHPVHAPEGEVAREPQ